MIMGVPSLLPVTDLPALYVLRVSIIALRQSEFGMAEQCPQSFQDLITGTCKCHLMWKKGLGRVTKLGVLS